MPQRTVASGSGGAKKVEALLDGPDDIELLSGVFVLGRSELLSARLRFVNKDEAFNGVGDKMLDELSEEGIKKECTETVSPEEELVLLEAAKEDVIFLC